MDGVGREVDVGFVPNLDCIENGSKALPRRSMRKVGRYGRNGSHTRGLGFIRTEPVSHERRASLETVRTGVSTAKADSSMESAP